MALSEWEDLGATSGAGGQGEVRKVRHGESGAIGALKTLHEDNQNKIERRFRFLNEVSALRALNGVGVPKVLDADESLWEDRSSQLYLVMEWIDGKTLQQQVNARKATIDEAKKATIRICGILKSCHALRIYHRDIKPDNVVMRGGDWDDPVLIDFGMSWTDADGGLDGFATPKGQEIGNRFLRLPEHAAGGDHHDHRSDICMAVGLLFFMLTGRAPRALDDGHGAKPHESSDVFPSLVLDDPRWPRIRRLFNVGFQSRMEARIQSVGDLQQWLEAIDDDAVDEVRDALAEEIARLNDRLASAKERRNEEVKPTMERANRKFFEGFMTHITSAGLEGSGQGPVFFGERAG